MTNRTAFYLGLINCFAGLGNAGLGLYQKDWPLVAFGVVSACFGLVLVTESGGKT